MKKWRVMEHEAGCGQSYFHVEEREPWFMFFAWNFRRSFIQYENTLQNQS